MFEESYYWDDKIEIFDEKKDDNRKTKELVKNKQKSRFPKLYNDNDILKEVKDRIPAKTIKVKKYDFFETKHQIE